MTDNVTSSFPTMGESLFSSVVNLSGKRTSYTKSEARGRSGGADVPGAGTKANRGASLIHEANGPVNKPVAMLYAANAAEAHSTQRNVRLVPSSVGNRDFWAKRESGPIC